jgi:uncharacterized lipoprotein NlpE involved in copper resistance
MTTQPLRCALFITLCLTTALLGCSESASEDKASSADTAADATTSRTDATQTSPDTSTAADAPGDATTDAQGEDTTADTAQDALAPAQLAVTPEQVMFGLVSPPKVEERTLTLRNVGAQPLTVSALSIEGSDEFSLSDSFSAQTLAPQGEVVVGLRYAPQSIDPDSAQLRIDSDDPEQPSVFIPLEGNGSVPCLMVDPEAVTLGGIVGTDPTETLSVINCGSEPLTVTGASLTGPDAAVFTVDGIDALTATPIARGDSRALTITFLPGDERAYDAVLMIESDADINPTRQGEVSVTGQGFFGP